MFKLTKLESLSTLPIPIALLEQVLSILTEPFHGEAETQQVCDELQCELWFITSITDLNVVVVDDIEQLK